MNLLAMTAILLASRLAATDGDGQGCKAALKELAAAAHAAEAATDAADLAVEKVEVLETSVESCRKERDSKASSCAKLEEKLKAAEQALDRAEEELTLSLEDVDAAYDEFDVACSWDDPDSSVQVRFVSPERRDQRRKGDPACRLASSSSL